MNKRTGELVDEYNKLIRENRERTENDKKNGREFDFAKGRKFLTEQSLLNQELVTEQIHDLYDNINDLFKNINALHKNQKKIIKVLNSVTKKLNEEEKENGI